MASRHSFCASMTPPTTGPNPLFMTPPDDRTMPDSDDKTVDELKEELRQRHKRVRYADAVIVAVEIAFFLAFVAIAWGCRDGCSPFSWFYLVLYPLVRVYYMFRVRQLRRELRIDPQQYEQNLRREILEADKKSEGLPPTR
jgi:hypothetical protein